MGGIHDAHGSRWRARPALARALSFAVFVAPIVVAYVITRLTAPLVAGLPAVERILALGVLAVAVGLVAERLLRRVLPLAALLRMTMLFPDRAPSRFKVARSVGNTRVLEERARTRPGETAGEAATRILGLLSTLSAHDRRTRGHSERVRVFTDVLAEELHLPQDARDRLRWASLLHDLGKVDVPSGILNKPASLDPAEWEIVRRHPARGAAMAGPLLDWLGEWGAAIEQHHERFDGLGYPRGLAGHDIALAGRIVAVADVFEVMTAARSYKRPMSVRAARGELADVAGTQLDPACVRAFLGAGLPRVLWAVGPLALLVNLPFLRGLAEVGKAIEQAGAAAAGQAATAAAAATAAVVVIASPGGAPATAADRQPQPRSSHGQSAAVDAHRSTTPTPGHSSSGRPAQGSRGRPTTGPTSRGTAPPPPESTSGPAATPSDGATSAAPRPSGTVPSTAPTPATSSAPSSAAPSTSASATATPTATATASATPTSSNSGIGEEASDPNDPVGFRSAADPAPAGDRDVPDDRRRGDLLLPRGRRPLGRLHEPHDHQRPVERQAPHRGPHDQRVGQGVGRGAQRLHGLIGSQAEAYQAYGSRPVIASSRVSSGASSGTGTAGGKTP